MVSGSVTASKYSWEKSGGEKSLRIQGNKNHAGKPWIQLCLSPSHHPFPIEEIGIDSVLKELRRFQEKTWESEREERAQFLGAEEHFSLFSEERPQTKHMESK